jgi:DNA-binding CsgD family transcriptional regulator
MVTAVVSGEMWFTRRSMSLFLEALGLVHLPGRRFEKGAALSERELQVTKMAMRGASNRSIGDSLGITERTVKAHMSSILSKLNLTHRAELCLLEESMLGPSAVADKPSGVDTSASEPPPAPPGLTSAGKQTHPGRGTRVARRSRRSPKSLGPA